MESKCPTSVKLAPTVSLRSLRLFCGEKHPPDPKGFSDHLIPKLDNPRPDAEEFRSMTVGSCVYLPAVQQDCNGRLSEVTPLNPHQKVFRLGTDGAFDNITTLTTIIREAHKSGKEFNIVSVDLAKAFDTVSHSSIDRALRMHGLDTDSRALIWKWSP
ncbi:Retrovirus-related Pol polyprotein from type-1 retrotransposable element [Trichinella spiralis]|uniref:Retrovirus-related Pol polyprotein from type-1 retrotransposable element n=1 Tax=Trichinella spiralis TaxID=6334 RepID=A0ABR3KN01_TRISP